MFKSELKTKLLNIFKLGKVSFSEPSIKEQEVMFVQIERNITTTNDKQSISRVTGSITVFANDGKLPLSYFSKKIADANKSDLENLYFYNMENNVHYEGAGNLVERTFEFVFFYKESYNPSRGIITEIEINP